MNGKSRFVWHDLNTTDVESAQRFYGELFNWRFEGGAKDTSGGAYLHIKSGDTMIGGVRKMSADEKMPPNWLGYIGVESVDAAVAATTQHGGKVFMPKSHVPNAGTFAVVSDPTGGVFAPWTPERMADEKEPTGMPGDYSFCWDELMTTDPVAATKFYTSVFGWHSESMEMGAMGTYTLLKRPGHKDEQGNDKNAGGVMKSPPGVPHSFWMTYVRVPDCDATVEKIKRLGGTVTMGAMEIPNIGRFSTMMDPQHAHIAVIGPNKK